MIASKYFEIIEKVSALKEVGDKTFFPGTIKDRINTMASIRHHVDPPYGLKFGSLVASGRVYIYLKEE